MSALQAMQDKNTTLEKNLSAETRVKLDLFSALGEAKRQLEIRDSEYSQKPIFNVFVNVETFNVIHRCYSAKGKGCNRFKIENCSAICGNAICAKRFTMVG